MPTSVLKMKNYVHFDPCRQPTNKKIIRAKRGIRLAEINDADMAIKILLKKFSIF